MNNNPQLQYRHSEGLGDLIACTLHSKPISPITNLLTRSKEMCFSCNKRRQALNYIFPIPFWKIFFENYDKKTEDFQKYFELEERKEENSDIVIKTKEKNEEENNDTIIKSNEENNDIIIQSNEKIMEYVFEKKDTSIPEYNILSESSTEIDDYIFKIIIYKKR